MHPTLLGNQAQIMQACTPHLHTPYYNLSARLSSIAHHTPRLCDRCGVQNHSASHYYILQRITLLHPDREISESHTDLVTAEKPTDSHCETQPAKNASYYVHLLVATPQTGPHLWPSA